MKKTTLAKLIERLNDYLIDARIVVDNPSDYIIEDVVEAKKQIRYTEVCIAEATELLEEERQNLIDAYKNGWEDRLSNGFNDQYFNNTYQQ